VGNDIPGEKKTLIGLTQIRGIGYNFANAILDSLKIDSNTNIGYLTDSQVQSIEKILKNPSEANFPLWFLNRRKDILTGEDKHLITSNIASLALDLNRVEKQFHGPDKPGRLIKDRRSASRFSRV